MRAVLILLVLAVSAAYLVVAQLPEGRAEAESWLSAHKSNRPQEIQSISFDGRGLPTAQLRAALSSHAGEQLDNAKLAADRTALETVLASRGYLAAVVDAPVVTYAADGGAFVTYNVQTGALFHLRGVSVTGPAARNAGVVTIAMGDVAEADRIGRAKQGVADALALHGKASVEAKLHVDSAAAVVDVELATR